MVDSIREKIAHAAKLLKSAKRAIAFTGAGISTPSGIPDFRSPNSGLWNNPEAMVVASLTGFRQNPAAFYEWILPLARTTVMAQPNPAHDALAWLEKQGYIESVITQNIDMLHTRAGSTHVYEIHGHLREFTCVHCFAVYDGQPIIQKFLEDGETPLCSRCGGVLKPNVILFGEQLPLRVLQAAKDAARKSDLVLVVGSSLEVYPASDIPLIAVRNGGQIVIINREPTPLDDKAVVVIDGDVAQVLPEIVQQIQPIE